MGKPYEIRQQLLSFSTDELCEIYERLNNWEWDERLGEAPDRFYELQNYARDGNDSETRETYILPYMREIYRLVPVYDLMRHYHIHVLGRTEEQFKNWWRESGNEFSGFVHSEMFGDRRAPVFDSVVSAIVIFVVLVVLVLIAVSLLQ